MMVNANPWDNLKFDLGGLEEVRRKFFGTLYNTYSFFALYANIDKFAWQEAPIPLEDRPEIDRWIISLLNSLVREVDRDYGTYDPTPAARKIQEFVTDNLSNWYVRLCRRRFWKGEYNADKISAYQTLSTCLSTVSQLMAPIAPFFADWLYRNLNEVTKRYTGESVHLELFPEVIESAIDKDLEQRMDYAQRISSLILSLRKKANIRVRQPLKRALLPVLDPGFRQQVEQVRELILTEVNIKDLEYIDDTSGIINKSIKPNFKTLGRRLGKDMKEAARLISELSQDDISKIEKAGSYVLEINGITHNLTLEDLVITSEDIPGWQVASDGRLTVALDIHLDDTLIAEGTARELVNRIQNIRKDLDFAVTDRINVVVEQHPMVEPAVGQFAAYICGETLADSLTIDSAPTGGQSVSLLDDVDVKIDVRKVTD
jgi:isoleucyl-tRNA synthetase